MSKTIDTKYDPDAVIGEWGWLWMGEESVDGDWILVTTYDDDEDGLIRVTGWSMDAPFGDTSPVYVAEDWRGTPYIPLSRPACEPGAGLLVTVRLPDGASVAHSWAEPCAEVDRAREMVFAALNPVPESSRNP